VNAYFLVEGRRCERKLYPEWLSTLVPTLTRARTPDEAQTSTDRYYLVSGEGYPSILDVHLSNAIADVEKWRCYDLLVVVLDADEDTVDERKNAVIAASKRSSPSLTSARLEIVVQNRCVETWLLGNRRAFVRNPDGNALRNYIAHYDARREDPELMPAMAGFNTHAQFHHAYLKAIFDERKMSYTKSRPGDAATQQFLSELVRRTTDNPGHLHTFSRFLDLCRELAS
jgi:hypothetical protein